MQSIGGRLPTIHTIDLSHTWLEKAAELKVNDEWMMAVKSQSSIPIRSLIFS